MEDRYIVAIDLGTTKIALAVAIVNGRDKRLVYYKETPLQAGAMRSSRIHNESKVAAGLKQAIGDAEEILGVKITGAVVGLPRYYVRTEENSASNPSLNPDECITEENVAELKAFAQDNYPLDDPEHDAVYGAVAQSFSTDEEFQVIESDVVGMSGKNLSGNFKIFIGNRTAADKIDRAMRQSGVSAVKKCFVPLLTADATLTPLEIDNGVALIDFGGGCTSLSIYYKDVLRYYSSIPFGGWNVTNDIHIESNIPVSLAENIKLAFGACMPDRLQNLGEKQLLLKKSNGDADRRLAVSYLSEIITAREEEIIRAMLYEIGRSRYADKLGSGVVVTGGGAQMTNLANFITELSGYNVRVGRPHLNGVSDECTGVNTPSATTAIGLVLAGAGEPNLSCALSGEAAALSAQGQNAADSEAPVADPTPTEDEQRAGVLPGLLEEEEVSEKRKAEEEKKRKKEEKVKKTYNFKWGFLNHIEKGTNKVGSIVEGGLDKLVNKIGE